MTHTYLWLLSAPEGVTDQNWFSQDLFFKEGDNRLKVTENIHVVPTTDWLLAASKHGKRAICTVGYSNRNLLHFRLIFSSFNRTLEKFTLESKSRRGSNEFLWARFKKNDKLISTIISIFLVNFSDFEAPIQLLFVNLSHRPMT